MNIETILLIVAPPCSISMFIWILLFFAKTPKAIRVRSIAFKIWAVGFLIIIITVLGSGLVWRLKEEGSIPLKYFVYFIIGMGLTIFGIKFWWDMMHGK